MDLTQFALGASILIGFVNGINLAINQNWKGFGLFCASVLGGTVFGMLHWFGIVSPEIGFALGVSASGTYEVAQRIGGK